MPPMTDDKGKGQTEQFAEPGGSLRPGLVREFWDFLKHNKKWWLLPILLVLLLIGALVFLSSSGVGAWMYTVF